MKTELKKQIVDTLEQYMSVYGVSQNEVAGRAGVNASYLIRMRQGNYTVMVSGREVEIADKYFEKIAAMTGFSITKNDWEPRAARELIETMNALEDAREHGENACRDRGCRQWEKLFGRTFPSEKSERIHDNN